jgi:hypothetical protein
MIGLENAPSVIRGRGGAFTISAIATHLCRSHTHNITQLLGCVRCDHVLSKHDSPLIRDFHVCEELSTIEFSTSNYILSVF